MNNIQNNSQNKKQSKIEAIQNNFCWLKFKQTYQYFHDRIQLLKQTIKATFLVKYYWKTKTGG